ncbi:hypothetical protein D9757_011714 [Collybiopsis confluens]|uniref:Uncharacterized protein n=1 Tax=Collybiopsis confluens TaxID=2823264 RepID=A0A8H5GE48_9AGAR|nr:hypothetical protein D9757_011714 [Collybiopsis confluens]
MSIPEPDIFARAYASAIKTQFQLDVGDHSIILTSPVTTRGMATGDLIPSALTNYLVYKFSDSLQYSDNPNYTGGSTGSYIQQFRSWIDWVESKADHSVETTLRLAKARDDYLTANKKYFAVQEQAFDQWRIVKASFPDMDFRQWAESNYQPLRDAEIARKAAEVELDEAMDAYFGADAAYLTQVMEGLRRAMGQDPWPGYNQEGLIEDADFISQALKSAKNGEQLAQRAITQAIFRIPQYTIPNYASTVQSWIEASSRGAPRDQVITIDVNEGRKTKWEDFGFKEVSSGSGTGFWPFFYSEVFVNNRWEKRTLETSGRENSVSLQLAMIGVQKFDIQPGGWDVPAVKARFPDRVPDAPNVLSPKVARMLSVIAAYDVQLKVSFASDMRDEVEEIYEEVKNTGGRMSVFGFHVSAGAGNGSDEYVETKFDDVKWDKASGTMSLTPVKGQPYSTILGAVAHRFD